MNAAFMQYDPRAGRPGGGRPGTAGSHASHKGTATTTGHWPGGRAGTCYAGKTGTSTVKNREARDAKVILA
jgi:hypothetical protein